MKRILLLCSLLVASCFAWSQPRNSPVVSHTYKAGHFPLVHRGRTVPLIIDKEAIRVIQIATEAFQRDIQEIIGIAPTIQHGIGDGDSLAVIIGQVGHSALLNELAAAGRIDTASMSGKWETFRIQVIPHPFKQLKQALVIMGSDARGTAFGVFEFCRLMGVSPWTWWADVHPAKQNGMYVSPGMLSEGPPSVQYRGIFLNDEDWGLQPWAASQQDTTVKDIGPHTYARIFELLLRLKANYIWPAMHPCTKAFYYYPQNPVLANEYSIVVGSSHCEPMLRNNVFEWAENYEHEYGKKPGEWRYDLNKEEIYQYWEDRIKQSARNPSVYTVGMRGIHDGSMPGPKPIPEKVKLLEKVIKDQRSILSNQLKEPASNIPQIFCPYKEVLTIYRNGLQLPEDVTIVWADDNHGYVRQLSNEQERRRSGGSGVYYHLSYWGSPEDYLWLSSISPSLISFEMTRAYQHDARKLWVFNVGDIKPAEMEISFAMDMAWNVDRWKPEKAATYATYWAGETFGPVLAKSIGSIKARYYELAQERKPEHLAGWEFSQASGAKRLAAYAALALQTDSLYKKIPAHLKDAYFQLVYYPVKAAALMNEKFIYAAQAVQWGNTRIDSALVYAAKANTAFIHIQSLTARYNDSIAGGKWKGMMSWHPRDRPVFKAPVAATTEAINKAVKERQTITMSQGRVFLPLFTVMTLPADRYVNKPGKEVMIINGLGLGGRGVTRRSSLGSPLTNSTLPQDTALQKQPYLEYHVPLQKGEYQIKVKCLPNQNVEGTGQLRYAISCNNDPVQVVNLHAESESSEWKANVLNGFSSYQTSHIVDKKGIATLRIYLPDDGLVVNEIEILALVSKANQW